MICVTCITFGQTASKTPSRLLQTGIEEEFSTFTNMANRDLCGELSHIAMKD